MMLFNGTTIPNPTTAGGVVQLRRDPFARCDTIRRRIYDPPVDGCAWCGYMCRTPRSDRPYLYQYSVSWDSGREQWNGRLFCQQSCFRNFTE